jgi:hypothetical protein
MLRATTLAANCVQACRHWQQTAVLLCSVMVVHQHTNQLLAARHHCFGMHHQLANPLS